MYKKRNVAYVRPNEPSFLTKLKKEAGYVPGPDVNTKREQLEVESDYDCEKPDENPVVVVLKPGDLTAEEAVKITTDKELEEANAPADLTKKIIFQKPVQSKRQVEEESEDKQLSKKHKTLLEKQKKKKKVILSFDQGEEDEC